MKLLTVTVAKKYSLDKVFLKILQIHRKSLTPESLFD